jgi:hypothetical protein
MTGFVMSERRSVAMSPVISARERTTRPRPRIPFEWTWVVIAVVAIGLVLAMVPHLRGGHFVDHLRVVNRSPYDIDVDVASSPYDGWMPIGTAANRRTVTADAVYDLGDVWYVRYRTTNGELQQRVARSTLEEDNWTVRVPDEFVDRLRAAGASMSPAPGS